MIQSIQKKFNLQINYLCKEFLFLENKYFYCYSKPLKDFLLENGSRYIIKSVHEKTKKKYWLFEGTEELNKLLLEWRCREH